MSQQRELLDIFFTLVFLGFIMKFIMWVEMMKYVHTMKIKFNKDEERLFEYLNNRKEPRDRMRRYLKMKSRLDAMIIVYGCFYLYVML